ncbi:MAG: MATE family efflux transporter [Bacteroidales bacterium]|nr:MATE family efflux transporter [Bacteroidales bacterium]MCF8389037.1 MATE family efflux transporter [Bacteroidales bacterium]MCF8397330.1 MATE family efflux transporter [Bacteroidales bacterium]
MAKREKTLALNKINRTNARKLINEIIESVSGTDQDFTSGNLGKAILLLSVPMVLEMVMESIFAVADIFFVSKLGADAIATVGITESLMTIVYALGFGLSMGTTALVSRRIGEKKHAEASNVGFQAILLGGALSVLIAIPGLFFSPELLKLMGANEAIQQEMAGYTSIILGGNIVIMMLFIINAVFRSAGDAAISMRVLWMANILNIILDPLLIFGLGPIPALGIEGAAIATTTGRGLAVIYQFYLLFKGKNRVQLKWQNLKVDFSVMRHLIKLSLGGIGQNIIATSSWIGLVRIIAEFGSVAMAGYTIAIRIVIFSLLPSWGVANAAATLVGQNLGAKKPKRAEKSVWVTGKVNMILLALVGILFAWNPDFYVGLFTQDHEIVKSGAIALRIISIGMLAYGYGMVMVQSFNGAGDTITPTWINFFCFWLLEIPLAYLLSLSLGFGEKGVYFSILISESILTLVAFILFKRGKWKLKEV